MNKKNIFIYLIIVFLIISKPLTVFAQASATSPTVTIAAGSGAAVGGLYNDYGTRTQMIATALTLAVLSATGAAVKLTEDSIAAGKTVYQVINDKFAQWVGGTSAEELTPTEAEELQSRFKVITGGGGDPEDPDNNKKNGVNVDDLGRLFMSRGALTMVREFIKYLESQEDGILNYEENTGDQEFIDFGIGVAPLSQGLYMGDTPETMYHSIISNQQKVACFTNVLENGKHSYIFVISNQPFTYYGTFRGSASLYKGYYYASVSSGNPGLNTSPSNAFVTNYNVTQFIDNITKYEEVANGQGIQSDGIYKGENYNSDLLDNPNNQTFVLDPGILPYINPSSNQQISIPDYLQLIIDQAQANATAQNQPISVPAIDPATLAGSQLQVPVIEQDPISDPMPSEVVDPDQTPDNPVQDSSVDPSSQESIELMLVDLTRIFPFCIPWDIYHLISKFNADPVTPSLDINFGNILGSVGINYSMHIDLHDYDGVAQILRTMELIAFVLGLAAATRSIFLHD